MERVTITLIREALNNGKLPTNFRAADVNRALKIDWAGNFLPKHRVGNPGDESELFVQVSRGLYRLK